MSLDSRKAGVLLHPTSLPGRFGIGDLGPECRRFLDWMQEAGLGIWQVLPLGPTGFGDSPYQCFSAFAGNPLLVSPEELVADGLLFEADLHSPHFPQNRVDYGPVIEWKTHLLRLVFSRFQKSGSPSMHKEFDAFKKRPDVKVWLDDYALFRVCKDLHSGVSWDQWTPQLRTREAKALAKVKRQEANRIEFHRFCQFLFFRQWEAIRAIAHNHGISIVGDAPIYVAYDSADTWANQEFFLLDEQGLPTSVAGVPPDYFSTTGQLWGNPLYDWDRMAADNYKWWIARMRSIFSMVDYVRLDHFRGFMGFWAVPFGEKTAINGRWRRGPGSRFFKVLKRKFPDLPIIAEDLGEITPDVTEVRDEYNLPGMRIVQFAFGSVCSDPLIPDPSSDFLPHNHVRNCVVYTGTHDNDTTVGWWRHTSTPEERHVMRVYLATDGNAPHFDLIRATLHSVANTAIIPMQDFLGLDSNARMNWPGRAEGNWSWRLRPDQLNWDLAHWVRSLTLLSQRCSNPPDFAVYHIDEAKLNYLDADDREQADKKSKPAPASSSNGAATIRAKKPVKAGS